jgi:hypothetical protein
MSIGFLSTRFHGRFQMGIWLAVFAWAFSGLDAQTTNESAAQRQLREDHDRFRREIDRQGSEAKAREATTRNALSEAQHRDDIERLRVQQAAQSAAIDRLNQTPIQPAAGTLRIQETMAPSIQISELSPDFAVTFLSDGRCVIHRKGSMPEVKSLEEAQVLLKTMIAERGSKSGAEPEVNVNPAK